ncbi:MAG: PfkB family carbohydrate kinase [Solirubrobacteraceae bacterium]|nr:PfkB family carbohydrate kinase [Solirubrobacteraceae bacterium]
MSLTVVGSVAFDAVETPSAKRDRMLGGAATHFALAASFFDHVNVVGVVGDDFSAEDEAVLTAHKIDTTDIEHVAGGKTFFWSGRYHDNMNSRDTLDTQLNVFETFEPKLSEASKNAETLFLANIVPAIQLSVLEQCEQATFTAVDSMDLWINIAKDDLLKVIAKVDCIILNDEEIEMLTGEGTIVSAARALLEMGPSIVVAKQGKYGAGVITKEGSFWVPAFPLHEVSDPTGAGDSFAGGFVGYIAAHPERPITLEVLRRAMAYGTAVASFNVEEFGTERVARLTGPEIIERVKELAAITQFDGDQPITLRR